MRCQLRKNLFMIPDIDTRPDWCPLVTADKLLSDVQSPFRDWGNWDESEDE